MKKKQMVTPKIEEELRRSLMPHNIISYKGMMLFGRSFALDCKENTRANRPIIDSVGATINEGDWILKGSYFKFTKWYLRKVLVIEPDRYMCVNPVTLNRAWSVDTSHLLKVHGEHLDDLYAKQILASAPKSIQASLSQQSNRAHIEDDDQSNQQSTQGGL